MPHAAKPPPTIYVPPGHIRISERALASAREHLRETNHVPPLREPAVVFGWAESRSVRPLVAGPWTHLGPGMQVCVMERADIPANILHTVDGLDFAVRLPVEVYGDSRERLIDVDEPLSAGSRLSRMGFHLILR